MADPTSPTQLKSFFDAFGFIVAPGLLRDEIGWIAEEFEALIRDEGLVHDPRERTAINACIERRERLCAIIDEPRLDALVSTLLGPDWCYYSSDGNLYSGDTGWHSDSDWIHGTCIKIPLYLDPIGADEGALRLIPGSHRRHRGGKFPAYAADAARSRETWGIEGVAVPATIIPSQPGDVIAFDTNCMHAAFGGGQRRRMIAIQFWTPFSTREQFAELDKHMSRWAGGVKTLHSELMHRSGGSERRRHLRQITQRHAVHPRYRDRPEVRLIVEANSPEGG